jgi:4-hydroxy-tetrahydrodipicolinate reductase
MATINVMVNGATGKLGQEVLNALCSEPDMTPVAGANTRGGDSLRLPDGSGSIPLSANLNEVLDSADVLVDFTNGEEALNAIRTAAPLRVNVVVGSTGMLQTGYEEAEALAREHGIGIIIAPNFALGAAVMIHLSKQAARFFDYADLTEMHHEAKIDSPSGTAIAIADATVESRGAPFIAPSPDGNVAAGTRGGTLLGITVHSARMPGRVAHHELVLSTLGQTLTIRHDSVSRESFMPGVMLAIRTVGDRRGMTVGLDKILER